MPKYPIVALYGNWTKLWPQFNSSWISKTPSIKYLGEYLLTHATATFSLTHIKNT